MTLLTICQNVARETGHVVPASIIGVNKVVERKLLAAALRTGKQLSRKDWCLLVFEHEFETCAGTPDYKLPSDFRSLIDRTTWNRTQSDPMRILSPQTWQELQSGLTESVAFDNFRIKAKKGSRRFFVDPTPSAVEKIVFEYQGTNWVEHQTSPLTYSRAFTTDTDEVLFDEDLFELGVMWRFMQKQGLPYFDERDEYERTINIDFADDCGAEVIQMVNRRQPFIANVGQTNFGS